MSGSRHNSTGVSGGAVGGGLSPAAAQQIGALALRVRSAARFRPGRLAAVTVRVPAPLESWEVRQHMDLELAALGLTDVAVSAERGSGPLEVELLEFER